MKIFIGLIAAQHSLLYRQFNAQKDKLAAHDSVKGRFPQGTYKFDAFDPEHHRAAYTIDKHLLEKTRGYDLAAVLVDQKFSNLYGACGHAMLAGFYSSENISEQNVGNSLSKQLAQLLKVLYFTKEAMDPLDKEHLMRLPMRNFKSPHLAQLGEIYKTGALSIAFQHRAKMSIDALSKLKKPRRNSSYNHHYFIDQEHKHFIFGRERHAQLPTGTPHSARCELTGSFRFGRRISTDQHFNVSSGDGDQTQIRGSFANCHDAWCEAPARATHLNMFSNDYF